MCKFDQYLHTSRKSGINVYAICVGWVNFVHNLRCLLKNLRSQQKFYATAGPTGPDKYELCWRCVSTSMLAHPKTYIIVERIKFFWVFTFTLSRNSWLVKVFTFTLSRKFSLSLFPESFHFHSLQDQLIGESLFRVFDEDNSGSLNFSEYLQVFRLLEIYLQNIRICQKKHHQRWE